MTDQLPDLFDKFAKLRDLSPAEIERIPEAKRLLYFKVAEASLDEGDVRDAKVATSLALAAAVRAMDIAHNAHRIAVPAPDRIDELRKQIDVYNGIVREPTPLPKTLAILDKAVAAVEIARAADQDAGFALKVCRQRLADAITQWQRANTPDPQEVYREHLKRLAEHNAKIKSGEIKPPVSSEVLPTSPLEIALRAGKTPQSKRPRAGLIG